MQRIYNSRLTLFSLFLLIICSCKEDKRLSYPPGGYSFPVAVNPNDSNEFFYVLKDSLSTNDSLLNYQEHYFFKAFDEENLSQKPFKEEIIRFVFQSVMASPFVITLTKNKLTVKKGIDGRIYHEDDLSRLTPIEETQYKLLKHYFPLNEVDKSKPQWPYIDSIVKVYPKLLDIAYYNYLWLKAKSPITEPMKYDTKQTSISESDYLRIANLINQSEYWMSKPFRKCSLSVNDGYGFYLEVNTTKKYNVVSVEGCPDDNSNLTRACQALVDFAGLNKVIGQLAASH